MKTTLTKGLSPDIETQVRSEFVGSYKLREVLKGILEDKRQASFDASVSKDAYNSPNWTFLQADARGYERALKEVISLIFEEK